MFGCQIKELADEKSKTNELVADKPVKDVLVQPNIHDFVAAVYDRKVYIYREGARCRQKRSVYSFPFP